MFKEDRKIDYIKLIEQECDNLKSLLVEKNKSYGGSAFEPVRIFSKAGPEEQLLVRIDDKIGRLLDGNEYKTEDSLVDLIGYLILLNIQRKINK